jgi:hypothetical protein
VVAGRSGRRVGGAAGMVWTVQATRTDGLNPGDMASVLGFGASVLGLVVGLPPQSGEQRLDPARDATRISPAVAQPARPAATSRPGARWC